MGRQSYAPELREEWIRLTLEGLSVASLARDYEPSEATIYKWVGEAREKEARRQIVRFIYGYYNTRRSRSALDYASPVEYERLHFGMG